MYRCALFAILFALALAVSDSDAKVCTTGGAFNSTSYGPPWGGINGGGITAWGVDLTDSPERYGVAADPDVLKLGSRVWIWPNPFGRRRAFRVFDTGGAIQGSRIDFYDWRSRSHQYGWGRRAVRVCKV